MWNGKMCMQFPLLWGLLEVLLSNLGNGLKKWDQGKHCTVSENYAVGNGQNFKEGA